MNYKGFTLAEVMITIGIIGIVAALTLPTIMIKKRNLELKSQFKTAYSLISQAVLRMSADNPNLVETYCSMGSNGRGSYQFIEDFSKYFQTTKLYAQQTRNLTEVGYKENFLKQSNGYEYFNPDGHNEGAFFIKNGMMIAASGCWWAGETIPLDFIVDTNGFKGPNRLGYDIFYFQIINKNIFLPATHKYTFAVVESQLKACCDFKNSGKSCHASGDNGTACSHFALRNQYPQDESKEYWENLP